MKNCEKQKKNKIQFKIIAYNTRVYVDLQWTHKRDRQLSDSVANSRSHLLN